MLCGKNQAGDVRPAIILSKLVHLYIALFVKIFASAEQIERNNVFLTDAIIRCMR